MIVSGVLALVAIGLGIWGFSTKSDLDDANDRIAALQAQAANERASAQSEEASLRAFGARERAAFRRVKRRFIREEARARSLKSTVNKEASELDSARKEAADAEGAEQKEAADLKAARQEAQLAQACVKGAVNALNRFVSATSARAGAKAAVSELEAIQSDCVKAEG